MANKLRRPELKTLIGIQIPKRYKRIFVDYLTDVQLIRLSFWLSNQGPAEISSSRWRLIKQEFDRRGLQSPALWRQLPFDNEAQRAEWELWATIRTARQKK